MSVELDVWAQVIQFNIHISYSLSLHATVHSHPLIGRGGLFQLHIVPWTQLRGYSHKVYWLTCCTAQTKLSSVSSDLEAVYSFLCYLEHNNIE